MIDDQRQEEPGTEPDPDNPQDTPDFSLPGAERSGADEPSAGSEAPSDSAGGESIKGGEAGSGGESEEISMDLGRWIVEGWRHIRDDLIGYVIAALIFVAINLVALKIHAVIWLAIAGPMKAGFFLMTSNHMRTGRPLIGDLFQAFNKYIVATLAMLVMTVFIGAGYLFCFIPGLFLQGIYFFTFLFIVDRGLDFWEAMEASRKQASRDYLEFALFALVLFVINCAGLLFFGIGLLITIPLSFAAVTCAYRDLVGLADEPAIRSAVVPPESPAGLSTGPEYPTIVE